MCTGTVFRTVAPQVEQVAAGTELLGVLVISLEGPSCRPGRLLAAAPADHWRATAMLGTHLLLKLVPSLRQPAVAQDAPTNWDFGP